MIDAVNKCSALGFVSSSVRDVCKWYIHLAEDHHGTNYTTCPMPDLGVYVAI